MHVPTSYRTLFSKIGDEILLAALSSFVCSVMLTLLYALLPRVRRTPGWLVQRAAMCEAAVSLCYVALCFLGRGHRPAHSVASVSAIVDSRL